MHKRENCARGSSHRRLMARGEKWYSAGRTKSEPTTQIKLDKSSIFKSQPERQEGFEKIRTVSVHFGAHWLSRDMNRKQTVPLFSYLLSQVSLAKEDLALNSCTFMWQIRNLHLKRKLLFKLS